MDSTENIIALNQLKDITARMVKILEGNGLPGIVQKVNFLETQRVLDKKDVDAITTIVRSIECEVGKFGRLNTTLEEIAKKVNSQDYETLINKTNDTSKILNDHLKFHKEGQDKRDKLTQAVNSAVIIYVVMGLLKTLLTALGVQLP